MDHRGRTARAAAAVVVALLTLAAVSPARADDAVPAVPTGPTVRAVVVTDGAGDAPGVAKDLEGLADQGLDVVDSRPLGRTLTVELPAATAGDLVAQVEASDHVAAVVPETTYTLFDQPNDPSYAAQATSLGVLRLPQAWDVTHGSSAIRLAVIDTGVAVGHPDLAGKVVASYDAVTGSTSVADAIGHGTMVASMAAAGTDNGIGLAGSGWDTEILAVKVADSDGRLTNSAVGDGIDWAVDHGADVINLSLGSDVDDPVVREAVARAVSADVVVVAAAGNGSSSQRFYPAALPSVLAVGATTVGGGARASFSQFGSWVDVGAPGVSITGADADYATGNDYAIGDGTSFASPLVAGIAALLRASRPDLDQASIRNALTSTTNGKDYGFAHGVVNAYEALGVGLDLAGPTVNAPTAGSSIAGSVTVDVDAPNGVDADHVQAQLLGGGPVVAAALSGGHASLTLDTFGSYGADTLRVVLCRQTLCSASGTDVAVTVANPAPVITAPSDGAPITSAFTVTGTSVGPSVRFLADGTTVLGTDTTAPFALTLPVSALTPGPHVLTAVACDAAGTRCATTHPSAPVSVTMARLSPTITSLTPNPFSPDGDGRKDLTRLTYDLDVASDVTIEVLRSTGSPFYTVNLGTQAAGVHTWSWYGHDAGGALVSSGTYTVVVHTAATVGSEPLVGEVTRGLLVDKLNPTLSSVTSTYPAVYPVKDGFRDVTNLSVTVSEATQSVAATVYDHAGKAVWTSTKSGAAAGKVSLAFSGRTTAGTILPAGTYSYAFRVVDPAWNVTSSGRHTVVVSSRKLSAPLTGTRTVTAEASFDVWYNDDDCSGLYLSTWAPGALHWEACSGGSVLSWHRLTIPSAVKYGSVRVSTYGRGAGSSSAYFRFIDDDDTYLGGNTFDSDQETHRSSATPITSDLLTGQRVRWSMLVQDGDAYASTTFTVTWTYYVLQ